MHELSIANSILEAVQAEAGRRLGVRVTKVGVRIGELSGVVPEALSFGFEALVRGTEWQLLQLEIETCPHRQRCPQCGRTFTAVDYDVTCPGCGESKTTCIGGDELELAYLEVEER